MLTDILLGQICFLGAMFACVAIMPRYVFAKNEHGLSKYGTNRRTVVFYSVAFVAAAAFVFLAALSTPSYASEATGLRKMFSLLGVLLMLVLISTYIYERNKPLRYLHYTIGASYQLFILLAGFWLALSIGHSTLDYILLLPIVLGEAICFLSLRKDIHKLFLGQIITFMGFTVLVCMVIKTG